MRTNCCSIVICAVVGGVQGKAVRIGPEQAGVHGTRVLHHDFVRFQDGIDSRDRALRLRRRTDLGCSISSPSCRRSKAGPAPANVERPHPNASKRLGVRDRFGRGRWRSSTRSSVGWGGGIEAWSLFCGGRVGSTLHGQVRGARCFCRCVPTVGQLAPGSRCTGACGARRGPRGGRTPHRGSAGGRRQTGSTS